MSGRHCKQAASGEVNHGGHGGNESSAVAPRIQGQVCAFAVGEGVLLRTFGSERGLTGSGISQRPNAAETVITAAFVNILRIVDKRH